jgi:hypothetical protein
MQQPAPQQQPLIRYVYEIDAPGTWVHGEQLVSMAHQESASRRDAERRMADALGVSLPASMTISDLVHGRLRAVPRVRLVHAERMPTVEIIT